MNWQANLDKLQKAIISVIDTGNNREDIVCQIVDEHPEYSKKDVHRALSQMKRDWLVVHRGYGYYTVTAWSQDGVFELTHAKTFKRGLEILASKGVFHCDMDREGVVFPC